ncbi:aldo/keto reductase [Dongia soli]|uniref:Aldo/keto reductase n=1 Tax=Dongia soli TaxID=600628 RepID=A0ABU5EAM6_9PROT|nr:aldo/keto reductase [Dongia soli]MDY0883408.1 aldo/keto reductase [Dongia soli]
MASRQLGSSGPQVFPLGLGCMGMSDFYGPADRTESLATLAMAIERGMTLLDTGDFYAMGHNELLLQEGLRNVRRDQVQISVKFGALRGPDGSWLGFDCRPAAVKNFVAYSLKRLGTDYIDIYRPARLDPNVPIEETIGAIADLIKAGYVRHIGLSEMGAETIRRAHREHPIVDLQIEYSLISRGIEQKILPACRELGIAVTAYGVLGRGLISGHWSKAQRLEANDFRGHSPRFDPANIDRNLALVDTLRQVATAKGVSVAQIVIAWALSRGSDIIPLVGARRRERLAEALGALEVKLTAEDIAAIEKAVPPEAVAGARYPEHGMASLDSER